jgi:hypothetical protein
MFLKSLAPAFAGVTNKKNGPIARPAFGLLQRKRYLPVPGVVGLGALVVLEPLLLGLDGLEEPELMPPELDEPELMPPELDEPELMPPLEVPPLDAPCSFF